MAVGSYLKVLSTHGATIECSKLTQTPSDAVFAIVIPHDDDVDKATRNDKGGAGKRCFWVLQLCMIINNNNKLGCMVTMHRNLLR